MKQIYYHPEADYILLLVYDKKTTFCQAIENNKTVMFSTSGWSLKEVEKMMKSYVFIGVL